MEKGVKSAAFSDLVGPDKYVKALEPVAGEDYRQLTFIQGARLTLRLPDGRSFSYPAGFDQSNGGRFNQVPMSGADEARRRLAVVNNLRALRTAANRYYESHGVTSATYGDIMGSDPHPNVRPVMGEDYRSVLFEKGIPLQVRLPDGRIVSEPNPIKKPLPADSAKEPTPAQVNRPAPSAPVSNDDAIVENLRKLNEAANEYYATHNTTSVTLDQLVGPGTSIPQLVPAEGEDYRSVLFVKGHPLRLYLKDGRIFVYPRQ